MFVGYLKSLVRSVDRPVIIISDGHPAHRAKYTRDYVEHEPKLPGLHLLPGYSPDLNPDQQVWNQLKKKLGKTVLKTRDNFIGFVRSQVRRIQKISELVKGFFRLHDTNYARRQFKCIVIINQ